MLRLCHVLYNLYNTNHSQGQGAVYDLGFSDILPTCMYASYNNILNFHDNCVKLESSYLLMIYIGSGLFP